MRITIDIGPSPSDKLKPDELANLVALAVDAFRALFPRDPYPFPDPPYPFPDPPMPDEEAPNPPTSGAV